MKYLLLIVLAACGPTKPPIPTAPSPPSLPVPIVPRSQPTPPLPMPDPDGKTIAVWVVNPKNLVCFEWDKNPEDTVTGYRLYTGTSTRDYTNVVDVPGGVLVTGCVEGLDAGKEYYTTVTAYNTAGLESEFSEELSYTVPYVIAPEDLVLTSTWKADGTLEVSFVGPEDVMSANEGVFEASTDLVNWVNMNDSWVYLDGRHTFTVAASATRGFFRLRFGVVK